MCLFTSARTVAMVCARSAGSEEMYCAGVLTFDGGFTDSSSSRTECITERHLRGLAAADVLSRMDRAYETSSTSWCAESEVRSIGRSPEMQVPFGYAQGRLS